MFFINKMHIEYVILKCYVIHCIILQCQNDVKIHKRLNILDINCWKSVLMNWFWAFDENFSLFDTHLVLFIIIF